MRSKNSLSTDVLRSVVLSSFFQGVVSIFNFGGALRQEFDKSPSQGLREDAEAIRGDWERVGQSLRWAISEVQNEESIGDSDNG